MQQIIAMVAAPGRLATAFEIWRSAERGRFPLWLPVLIGVGVLGYFALRQEPPPWAGASIALLALAGAWLARPWPLLRGGLVALTAAGIGFGAGQLATAMAPPLDQLPKHAAIYHGTVRGVEAVPKGRRITLDDVSIADGDGDGVLHRRLRIRLKSNDESIVASGDRISVRALVQPASPPAYPGAWDMQRDAFFSDLGGSGYAQGNRISDLGENGG